MQTRLSYYASSKRERAVLGQSRSTIDLPQTLHDGGVLLVSTAEGAVGRDVAALVGASLLNLVDAVIREQGSQPFERRRGALVVVDERQSMLSELATQSLAKLDDLSRAFGDLCITRGRWGDSPVPGVVPSPHYLLERNRRVRTSASPLFPGDSTRRFRPFPLLGLGRTKGYPVRPSQVVSHHLEPHLNGIPLQPLVPHPVMCAISATEGHNRRHLSATKRPHRRHTNVPFLARLGSSGCGFAPSLRETFAINEAQPHR